MENDDIKGIKYDAGKPVYSVEDLLRSGNKELSFIAAAIDNDDYPGVMGWLNTRINDFRTGTPSDVLRYGAARYGRNNWAYVYDGLRRFKAALLRHLVAYYIDKEDNDKETNISHLSHAYINALFCEYFHQMRDAD